MTLRSPFDDFVLTTLACIPGLLARLDYVAGLRQEDGTYQHWGLARVHGQEAAQQAAGEAHRLLFSDILSTPLAQLLEDAEQPAGGSSAGSGLDLNSLAADPAALAPAGAARGPLLHFNSVLHALSALARSRTRTSRPTS